ncbi:metallophosphoesterase [Frigidibacter sp. ROC022]|uniref:metallophosphoesterase n=1 Tax=Frigidibacter sp. ROC022 TaxID=2971796 RepID=UPI00215A4814|nr:metallophosphoesterase [Frigidibacter sp. ROC022]MCR8724690.1 metallophosphoesterase [Frigidibacter sp. ROC022]
MPVPAPPAPEEPIAVIGDVHGCAALLDRLLERLAEEAPAARKIFVGDLIDRGDDSAGTLARLRELPDAVCLQGNHEEICFDFLHAPEDQGPRWLKVGGLQTLASFGIGGLSISSRGAALSKARDDLVAAMGEATLDWLRGLPSSWQSGNVLVTHAGADPAVPPGAQADAVLHWGHRDFGRVPRQDGVWVVHGHVIVDEVRIRDGRISVDTGAYAHGRLSAVVLAPGEDARVVTT